MLTRLIVPALLGALVLAAPVLAAPYAGNATPSTQSALAGRCVALQKRFDSVIENRGNAARAAEARLLRDQGGRMCTGGEPSAGIAKVEQALRDMGVTPARG